MPKRPELEVDLHGKLPAEVGGGHGTCLLLGGSCHTPHGPPRAVRLLLNGRRQPLAGILREAEECRWWGVLELAGATQPQLANVELEVRLPRSRQTTRVGLGTIAVNGPWHAPPLEYRAAADRADGSITGALALRPAVAVCMPVRAADTERLRDRVDALLGQTYENWFCLIGALGSHGADLERIRDAIGDSARVRFHEVNADPDDPAALEQLLKGAPPEAPYLVVPSEADSWTPHTLESMLRTLTPEAGAVVSSGAHADRGGRRRRSARPAGPATILLNDSAKGATVLFRRELLEWLLPFPTADFEESRASQWIALVASSLGRVLSVRPDGTSPGQPAAPPRGDGARPGPDRRSRSGTIGDDWAPTARVSMAMKARILEARCGDYLERSDRRRLRRIAAAPSSLRSRLLLALRATR